MFHPGIYQMFYNISLNDFTNADAESQVKQSQPSFFLDECPQIDWIQWIMTKLKMVCLPGLLPTLRKYIASGGTRKDIFSTSNIWVGIYWH